MKIALAHDFLMSYGGAERVLEVLHEVWPEAPVYTAFVNKKAMGKQWQRFAGWDIRSSWGEKVPFIDKLASPLRLLAKPMFESFDISGFEAVISSTSMYMAKAIGRPDKKRPIHFCYCHTPPRPLYGYPTASNWQRYWWGRVIGGGINFCNRIAPFCRYFPIYIFVTITRKIFPQMIKLATFAQLPLSMNTNAFF